jgi:Bacterial Ig-like domain (group 3)
VDLDQHGGRQRQSRRAVITGPRRATGEAGFSILEVIIATAVLMTVLVSVSSLLGTIFKVGANSRFEQEATEIASSTLDNEIATGASALLGETGDTALPTVTSGPQQYLLEMEVAPFDPSDAQCVSPASDPGAMLKVTIWSTWTNQKTGSTWWIAGSSSATNLLVEEASVVAIPAANVNPALGSILVTIEGASGQAITGLSVTATPSSGTAQTVTTTAGGCALFNNVTPTSGGTPTWSISFGSVSGYMTEQELTSIPAQTGLSVTADATTSLYFEPTVSPDDAYDEAGTVTPVYAVPTVGGLHPILPSDIYTTPLSFYSTNLTVDPYVSASPAQVFPMAGSPSYDVVAGTCGTDSAPGGGTVAGTPVTVTAGGSASPTINLVPVKIYVNYGGSLVSTAAVTASMANTAGTGADTNCPTTGVGVMPTLQLGSTTATWTSAQRGRHRRNVILLSTCSSNCATTTALTSSLNPSTAGASVTFTATVTCTTTCAASPGVPSAGTVQFKDAGTAMGSAVTVSASGVATYTTATLAVGTQAITAVYSGSGTKWATSTSSSLSQVVNGAPTTTTLTASPNPNSYGTAATLKATVACTASGCGTPAGTVKFTNNSVTITGCSAVTLSAGVATCSLSGLNGGTYSVAAVYTPSSTSYVTSTSSTVSQQVVAASTTTALTSSANPSTFGSSVTFTATVTPASGSPAVGSVAFMNGSTTLSTVTLNSSGIATYALSTLAVGSYSLSAVFTPTNSSNFGTSTGTLTQVVNAAAGTSYTLCGLPYGVWLLSATYTLGSTTYKSSNESTQVVVEVTPSGIYAGRGGTFGSLLAAGSAITVYVQ